MPGGCPRSVRHALEWGIRPPGGRLHDRATWPRTVSRIVGPTASPTLFEEEA